MIKSPKTATKTLVVDKYSIWVTHSYSNDSWALTSLTLMTGWLLKCGMFAAWRTRRGNVPQIKGWQAPFEPENHQLTSRTRERQAVRASECQSEEMVRKYRAGRFISLASDAQVLTWAQVEMFLLNFVSNNLVRRLDFLIFHVTGLSWKAATSVVSLLKLSRSMLACLAGTLVLLHFKYFLSTYTLNNNYSYKKTLEDNMIIKKKSNVIFFFY